MPRRSNIHREDDEASTEEVLDLVEDDSGGNVSNEHEHGDDLSQEQNITSTETLRRSSRIRKIPTFLKDYKHQVNNSASSSYYKTIYSLSSVLSYDALSKEHLKYTVAISSNIEPHTYDEACQHPEWITAMKKKIKALQDNRTWYITELPPNKTPIGCKWVYKIKRKADGTIERYKARLVAKGFTQLEGIDYLDTFSPVAKHTTIRLILALAAAKNWHLHQLDVDNAFLHGDLNEEAYMIPPSGLKDIKHNQVCKLTKSLYGLKQASCQWFAKLSSFLISINYIQYQSDHSLFVKKTPTTFTTLVIYVDDIVLAGDSLEEIENIKCQLNNSFKIKDLGHLKYFLGLEVARSRKGIHVC